jgi:Carboxypeptidase regulatory-like domain
MVVRTSRRLFDVPREVPPSRRLLLRSVHPPRIVLLASLLGWLAFAASCPGQGNAGLSAVAALFSSGAPLSVSGRVVNAVTGQPVSRALVRFGGRAVLSDHEGKFEFPEVTADRVYVQVTKPGFYASLDPTRGTGEQVNLTQLDGPIELRLYPEALITGTVTAPSGDPISKVTVQALRSTVDESGQRWIIAAQSSTDSHGSFRLPVAPGDYAVEIPYLPHVEDLPEAILPLSYPAVGSTVESSTLHLESGTEQHLDLHPDTRPTHVLRLRAEWGGAQDFPQLQARRNDQLLLNLSSTRLTGTPGEFRTDLPSGSYILTGTLNGPDGIEYTEASVTVGDRDLSSVILHFQSLPPIPVEVLVDPASTSDAAPQNAPPSVQQLGLSLHSTDPTPELQAPSFPLMLGSNQPTGFHAAPGRYRISARAGGLWYVKAISAGGTDLLTQDFVVAAGSTGQSVQVLVSNQTATCQGTLKINGKPASSSIYVIATSPSASPLLVLRSSAVGSFKDPYLPPGSYLAIAFEAGPSGNLLDPAVQASFSTYARSFQVAAGETANLDLDAVPAAEVKP